MGCLRFSFHSLHWLVLVLTASAALLPLRASAAVSAVPEVVQKSDEAFFKKLKKHYSGQNRPRDSRCSHSAQSSSFQAGFDSGLSGESYLLPLGVVDLSPHPQDPREEAKRFKPNLACKNVSDQHCCELGFREGESALRVAIESVPSGDPKSPSCAREMTEGATVAIQMCRESYQIQPPDGITFAAKRSTTGSAYCSKEAAENGANAKKKVDESQAALDGIFSRYLVTQTRDGQYQLERPILGRSFGSGGLPSISLGQNSLEFESSIPAPSPQEAWFDTPLSPASVFSFHHDRARSEPSWTFGQWLREMELNQALRRLDEAKTALQNLEENASCTSEPTTPLPDQKYQGCFVSGFSNLLHSFLPSCEEKILEEASRLSVGGDPTQSNQSEKKPATTQATSPASNKSESKTAGQAK